MSINANVAHRQQWMGSNFSTSPFWPGDGFGNNAVSEGGAGTFLASRIALMFLEVVDPPAGTTTVTLEVTDSLSTNVRTAATFQVQGGARHKWDFSMFGGILLEDSFRVTMGVNDFAINVGYKVLERRVT